MTMTDAPFKATLKSSAAHDSSWIVVSADNAVEFQSRLEAIQSNGLGAVLAGADKAFKAAFTLGDTLGASPVNPPQAETSYQAPQAANPWATGGQDAPAQADNPWGGMDQPQQGAQPQQAGNFEGAGAPMVLGMPARKVSGTSKKTGRPWEAWADPRPKEATQHIQARTDDPNDPALAAGQATFWKFI